MDVVSESCRRSQIFLASTQILPAQAKKEGKIAGRSRFAKVSTSGHFPGAFIGACGDASHRLALSLRQWTTAEECSGRDPDHSGIFAAASAITGSTSRGRMTDAASAARVASSYRVR